jgi:outer membrane protein OmpA-like peptidoglycan-associated protein
VLRAVALAALVVLAMPARAAPYDDPDAPDTVAAADAAVARLGAAAARDIVATVRNVPALQSGVAGAARGIEAKVTDLKQAIAALDADESPLEVRIELPADVLFDVDRAEIRPDAAQALAHTAVVIRSYGGPVRLVGHTDADGSDAHNLDLSVRRAASVRDWLVAKESLDAARFATEGLGETAPRAPNDTPANKQLNRRVEVVVRKAPAR